MAAGESIGDTKKITFSMMVMKMSRRPRSVLYRGLSLLAIAFLFGCGNNQVPDNRDTTTRGTIHISVDESFKPIIDSQIRVFESSYPNAKIIAHYKAEAECLKDLDNDSIRMVIVTRALSKNEEKSIKARLQYNAIQGKMAYDAIAVLVNNNAKDSIFDMADLRSMLKGTSGYKYKMVMDGLTATSTVRYALDSLLKGEPFGKTVMAATSSTGVIDHVSANADAIGFVGVSWIGNREDPNQLSFLRNVKIASIECSNCRSEEHTS